MKKCLFLLTALLLLCAFAGCGNGINTAEKPCVLVRGTLYYLSPEKPSDALPEGYMSAGKLEGVRDFPRAEMTGLVPDGSEVFVSELRPEAVYVRMDGRYACFTVEKLQYAWLRVSGILYLREEDYRKAYGELPQEGDYDGSLPAGAEFRGNLRSFVPDAFPYLDFETNFHTFVGYALYTVPGEADAVYIRKEPGTSGAIRFLRDPEAIPGPMETPAEDAPSLYDRFFAEAEGENLSWTLEDAEGGYMEGSWTEHPFPLPPVQGYDWQEEHYSVPEDVVDRGFSVHFAFQWALTITDEARDASVTYYGHRFQPMNIVRCRKSGQERYYCYELPQEERDPNKPPDNDASFWTIFTDAATEAREAVAGHLEQEPKREFSLLSDSLLAETVAEEYVEAYTRPFTEALVGNRYAASSVVSEIEVLEYREDGNAFLFRARLGFTPKHWGWFNACMGGENTVWKEGEKRLYVPYCFCLEKWDAARADTKLPQLWRGTELPELTDYETYTARHGSWFSSHMSPKADDAVRKAVLAHNRGGYAGGEFPCESHMLIAMSEAAGLTGDTTAVTYYLMVDYREYDETEEGFAVTAGSCVPCILTFDVDAAGDHTLTEYWEPMDGDVFSQLTQRFPGNLTEEQLDAQNPKYRNTLPAACDAQAEAYFSVDREQRRRQALAASLREDYPFCRDTLADRASFSYLFPEGDWLRYSDYAFRAEVVGDWETLSRTLSPSGNPGDGLDTVVDTCLLPVKVTEWLDSRDGTELPEDPLWLAWTYVVFDFADMEHFPVGASFVFCGSPASGMKEYRGQPVVSSATPLTFYVTEDGHILSFDWEPAVDAYSGETYEEFRDVLRRVAGISGWHG